MNPVPLDSGHQTDDSVVDVFMVLQPTGVAAWYESKVWDRVFDSLDQAQHITYQDLGL